MGKLSLTFMHLEYIMEQSGEKDPKKAVEYFASVMKKEGIRPKYMPQVVEKLMQRQRKQLK